MTNKSTLSYVNILSHFRNHRKGETCFILGNGPSLNDVDPKDLEGYKIFGSNRVYLHPTIKVDYYCAVNPLVIEQYADEIKEFQCDAKFLPEKYADAFDAVGIDTSSSFPHFGFADEQMWEGYTVTFVLLQLAWWMGFERAILLGVDHDYGSIQIPNQQLVAVGPDKNHFSPDYFSDGTRWNAPDLARSELAYSLAKDAWEYDEREVWNASSRTKLKVFPLGNPLRELDHEVSAIVSAYKAEKWIVGCLQDLTEQTMPPEIVVVCEEGSAEEKAAQECKRMGRGGGWRVEIVTTKGIPGVYEAWNLGIKASRGRYITNANTDDRHFYKSFEVMINVLDARPDIDLVYHDQFICWNDPMTFDSFVEKYIKTNSPIVPGRYTDRPGIFEWPNHNLGILNRGCYVGPQPMWRRSLHQLHGYFDESYKSAGDYDFWLRVAKPENFFHISYPMGVYCARMGGIEISDPVTARKEFDRALQENQSPVGLTMSPNTDLMRFDLGNEYCYSNIQDTITTVKQLLQEYN